MTEIYKLLRPDDYRQFLANGCYVGSADDRRDRFIHLSAANQWEATRAKWFADAPELWLVGVDVAMLGIDLRWEVSRDGARFPHLYRALLAADVTSARELFRAA